MKPEDMSRLLRAAIPPDMDGEEIEDDEGCEEYEESEESADFKDIKNAEKNDGHTQFMFLMTP